MSQIIKDKLITLLNLAEKHGINPYEAMLFLAFESMVNSIAVRQGEKFIEYVKECNKILEFPFPKTHEKTYRVRLKKLAEMLKKKEVEGSG